MSYNNKTQNHNHNHSHNPNGFYYKKKVFQPSEADFTLDDRVTLRLKPEFAVEIGELLLEKRPEDKRIIALAERLRSVIYVDDDADDDADDI